MTKKNHDLHAGEIASADHDQTPLDDVRVYQRGGAIRSFILFIVFVGLMGILAVGGGGYIAYGEATRPGPHETDTVVLLESGSSVAQIAATLEEAGVLRHPQLFVASTKIKGVGGALKAGEFQIPAGASTWDLVDLIVDGKSILHYVTVPEGLTTAQALRIIEANERLEGEITLSPAEGDLLPETYAFTRGQTRDQIINTMMKAQDAFIDGAWDDRALELPYSTRDEAIILASIIEKETGVAAERERIAAVFVHRLRKGMRLESDPTIIYGLTGGEPLGRGLRVSELKRETPYNTYRISGLPPTPIANPGKDAILATLNPASTDDLFFVADGSGGHAFASSLTEHNRNVANWRRIERERQAAAQAAQQ
ncbi:MAG: endolytic transglycosylase MltG [Pseudomonadota bacterium]